LAKLPERRYQTAAGLRADLALCQAAWRDGRGDDPLLLGQADVSDRFELPEILVGREAERTALLAAFDRVAVGGAREVVTTPAAGRIVPRTPQGFAAALGDLLAHPPDAAAVRACAARFTWEANTAALYGHLRGLVDADVRSPSPDPSPRT
ncbi:MAG: hypothetical protein ACK4ZY_15760, partial [Sphingomonas sp.]